MLVLPGEGGGCAICMGSLLVWEGDGDCSGSYEDRLNRMTDTANKTKTTHRVGCLILAMLGVLVFDFAAVIGRDAQRYRAAERCVESVNGSISAVPGFPVGFDAVYLEERYCGVIAQEDLVRVLRCLKKNTALRTVFVNGQALSREAMEALAELPIEVCGMYGCQYAEEDIALLNEAAALQHIWTDPDHIEELQAKLRKNVRVRVDHTAHRDK